MKLRFPDYISVYHKKQCDDLYFESILTTDKYEIKSNISNDKLKIFLTAKSEPIEYIRLFWRFEKDEKRTDNIKILGDEWERTYGTTSWQGIMPRRCMPWVCSVSNGSDSDTNYNGRFTECFGVETNPSAMCFWQYCTNGITLWLDVRCGGEGVILNGRTLEMCSVIFGEYKNVSAFDGIFMFYKTLCNCKLELDHKIYGGNNWYYAYGVSSHNDILNDTAVLSELCKNNENKPYMVIDSCWEENASAGPWEKGRESFPDMKLLANEICKFGVRPGIWVRPLSDRKGKLTQMKDEHRISHNKMYLDPSHPDVLKYIGNFLSVISKEWGYKLIKHDFSTYDIFGTWGFECAEMLASTGWSFYDKGKTSAEIVKGLYKTIHDSVSEDTVILGCNVIGHLAAGYAHINRVGDDTSGMDWDRTRHYGVNTLAFRMCHSAFFVPDADCVGLTEKIEWSLNEKWLDIVSKSGTALFVSADPKVLNNQITQALKKAYSINSVQQDVLKPLDWMENSCPERWLLNGKEIRYDWYPSNGIKSINETVFR